MRQALATTGLARATAEEWCARNVHYQRVPMDPDGYGELAAHIASIEKEHELPGNRAFYLALPPSAFSPVIQAMGQAGLASGPGWTRLVVEKPFGHDLASAQRLNTLVHTYFDEEQVYRIDHYLGKETVRNLLVLRFANTIFERAWNRDHIAWVEITVAEDIGVENRAGYYDETGAVRDMMQSHLTQVLTLIAMEPPVEMTADAIRNEKVKVLRAINPVEPSSAVLGQYDHGEVDGEPVPAYRLIEGIPPDTTNPTFAAAVVTIDSWRWQGVPFLLRTGKRLSRNTTRIVVNVTRPPVNLFGPVLGREVHRNSLEITLQPEEGFALSFEVKTPGERLGLEQLPLTFSYADHFGTLPRAYETLIRDVIEGDPTLFVRSDEVEESWRIHEPLLDLGHVELYPAGSEGPPAAIKLAEYANAEWAPL